MPTLDYYELDTVLAMAANVVNDRPIVLRSRPNNDLVPLTVKQLLSGMSSGALLNPRAGQDKQYFGASRYKQDTHRTPHSSRNRDHPDTVDMDVQR